MNCTECRSMLAMVDLEELIGTNGSELSTHLSVCADCRMRAAFIVGGSTMLAGMVTARGAAAVQVERTSHTRIVKWALLPVAATILGVFMLRPRPDAPLREAAVVTAHGVSVRPAAGQKATVIPTSNPKITIVWLSNGDAE